MPAPVSMQRLMRVPPILVAAALFIVQIACTFPGELISDSRDQLRQALLQRYTDWHPPVMALVWSVLLRVSGSAGSLLVLHQFLHWCGIGLIADACHRVGRRSAAWAIVAVGAFPMFLVYDRILMKDVGMASGLVAGSGLIIWFLLQRRPIPLWAMLLSGLCLAYGVLIRANAVFAIGPLLLLYGLREHRFALWKVAVWSVFVAVIAVPLSNWINHRWIGASQQYPMQSLQIFDLMGIAVHSNDIGVLGEHPPPMQEVRACYTPYWWDPASPWGSCHQLRLELGYTLDPDTTDPSVVPRTAKLWRAAIAEHPWAYLQHRLHYFNSSIYFIVPALQFRFSKAAALSPVGARVITERDVRLDYLKNNCLNWPVVWIYVGACVLMLLGFAARGPIEVAIARLLIASGLLFAGAYLLIGVATEFRYYYWSIMAVLLACILAARELLSVARLRRRYAAAAVAGLLLVLLVGYAARILDVPFV